MADAIPSTNPEKQPEQATRSTVIVQAPISQWQALKQAGWWAGFDWTMLGLIGVIWLTVLYWTILGQPTAMVIVIALLISIVIMLVWLLWAIFRCALFVLRLHADVAMMPESAARLAAAYLAGKQA